MFSANRPSSEALEQPSVFRPLTYITCMGPLISCSPDASAETARIGSVLRTLKGKSASMLGRLTRLFVTVGDDLVCELRIWMEEHEVVV